LVSVPLARSRTHTSWRFTAVEASRRWNTMYRPSALSRGCAPVVTCTSEVPSRLACQMVSPLAPVRL